MHYVGDFALAEHEPARQVRKADFAEGQVLLQQTLQPVFDVDGHLLGRVDSLRANQPEHVHMVDRNHDEVEQVKVLPRQRGHAAYGQLGFAAEIETARRVLRQRQRRVHMLDGTALSHRWSVRQIVS